MRGVTVQFQTCMRALFLNSYPALLRNNLNLNPQVLQRTFVTRSITRLAAGGGQGTMGSLANVDFNHIQYPKVRRDEFVKDNYHGVEITDPYRSLEDLASPETKEFVEKQVDFANGVLADCETLEKNPEDSHCHESLEGDAEVLLDPNSLSSDGTMALSTKRFNEDAEFMAYGLSSSGSDWNTMKVMRVKDRVVQSDTLSWVKFTTIAWTHDNKGFFYNRYPEPKKEGANAGTEIDINLFHKLYYHFLGTDQSENILCWRDVEDASWLTSVELHDPYFKMLTCSSF